MNDNNKNINNEEEMTDIFTLTDEDGNEIDFEVIGEYEKDGQRYFAMIPVEDENADSDICEYVILKLSKDGEEETVLNNDFEKNTFSIICNKYQEFKVNGVLDFNTYGVVSLDGYNNRILRKGDYIVLRKKNYCYKYEKEVDKNDNLKEVTSNPLNSTNYLGFERIIFLGKVYIWTSNITEILCEVITDNIFKYSYDNGLFYYGETIEIEDYSVINEYGKLNDGINFYEYNETLSLKLPISTTCGKGLNDETISLE